MSERLQTVLVRRTTAKRRITNITSRFSRVLTDDNACQTVHDLRIDMRNALETFRAVDDQLRPLLEAAEANALPTDKPIMSRTVSEDIINSAEYITSAEDMLFEACRYIESHSAQTSNISTTVASYVSEPRGQRVSFRPMTHDDCGRFRHASGDWTRDDVERWDLLRRLPSSLRTTLEMPSPPLHMAELLRKADELYVTLPTTTVSSIGEAPTELATAVYACDVPAVNALFMNRGSGKGSTEYKKPSSEDQLCLYHLKFRDQARYCTGLPCPRHRPDLKKGRKSQAGNATGGQ